MTQDLTTIEVNRCLPTDAGTITTDERVAAAEFLAEYCHNQADKMGWWDEYDCLPPGSKEQKYWIGSKLMLVVSEVSEAMEGMRKGIPDDHLPHRSMLEVELADAVIRILDLAKGLGLDLPGALADKLDYNLNRPDHQPEARKAIGGKSI